ncbi:sigma-70 family RNA polymerase sigma factor [Stenotrophomonas acidaminiphila]|uniref:sigma-70 family RNA polymerase sigma factor n=1 Tax=Stenotrophomonas acidaminiphila TaxID=128780 RepID=UPI0028A8BB65|nr:sigma-70 family RNA polymerase sigma factor [Stenotrophomonas acidaminiphila]
MSAPAPTSASPADPVEAVLRALFEAGLDGDPAAYRCFLDALSARLRAFLRRRLGGAPDDVEDILQETLLAIHNSRHTYRSGEPLTAWVYAIARYKLMDFHRSHHRREALNLPLEAAQDVFAASDTESAQARHDIGQLLEALPDRHRLPILHVKLGGLSVSETARLTGMSESAVKVGIHRGLKALALKIRSAA